MRPKEGVPQPAGAPLRCARPAQPAERAGQSKAAAAFSARPSCASLRGKKGVTGKEELVSGCPVGTSFIARPNKKEEEEAPRSQLSFSLSRLCPIRGITRPTPQRSPKSHPRRQECAPTSLLATSPPTVAAEFVPLSPSRSSSSWGEVPPPQLSPSHFPSLPGSLLWGLPRLIPFWGPPHESPRVARTLRSSWPPSSSPAPRKKVSGEPE